MNYGPKVRRKFNNFYTRTNDFMHRPTVEVRELDDFLLRGPSITFFNRDERRPTAPQVHRGLLLRDAPCFSRCHKALSDEPRISLL